MILRVSKLSQRKIITANGKEIATLQDILYDLTNSKIASLYVSKSNLLADFKLLLLKEIQSFNVNGIVVDSEKKLSKTPLPDNFRGVLREGENRLFLKTMLKDGHTEYGVITDIFFETSTGAVLGIEYMPKNSKESKTMKIERIIKLDSQVTLVKPVMVKKGQTTQTKPDINPDLRKRIEETIGKYATKNILLPSDEILIKQNDILTHESLRIAYTYGLLDQALQHASTQPVKQNHK